MNEIEIEKLYFEGVGITLQKIGMVFWIFSWCDLNNSFRTLDEIILCPISDWVRVIRKVYLMNIFCRDVEGLDYKSLACSGTFVSFINI